MAKKLAVRETDLYLPIYEYLIKEGYTVRSEVRNCDITATKGDQLIVIELKRSFNSTLLIQATERQRFADSVYVAVPRPEESVHSARWRGIQHVLKRLELGLILVTLHDRGSGQGRIDVIFHPGPFQLRKNPQKRRAVLAEVRKRTGDYNQAGSVGRKLMTAYREQAIHIGCLLALHGPLSPRNLRELGGCDKTPSILRDNYYGWFARVKRGVYTLTPDGRKALEDAGEVAALYF